MRNGGTRPAHRRRLHERERVAAFDAHFRNILTDGERLYFADLGLATSPRFDLSADESDFVARNLSHDLCYAVMQLVNWLVTNVCGVAVAETGGPADRNEYIRRWAQGAEPVDVPPAATAIITRYAPVTVVMNDFYWDLFGESRATPYPVEDIRRAIALVPSLARPALEITFNPNATGGLRRAGLVSPAPAGTVLPVAIRAVIPPCTPAEPAGSDHLISPSRRHDDAPPIPD